jgi:hypothetical protein
MSKGNLVKFTFFYLSHFQFNNLQNQYFVAEIFVQ